MVEGLKKVNGPGGGITVGPGKEMKGQGRLGRSIRRVGETGEGRTNESDSG